MDAIIDNGTASSLVELSSNVVQLVALLVDTWLGCCIMNHDAKQTNSKQLDKGLMFLPLCLGEMKMLLQHHSSNTQEESIGVAGCTEWPSVDCMLGECCMMSELLAFTGGGETIGGHAKQCGTPCCTNKVSHIEREYLIFSTPIKLQGTWL